MFYGLLMAASCAAGAHAVDPDGIEVGLTQRPDDAYEVEGTFAVDASSASVLDVLGDYERIPEFVPSMRLSHVRETRPDGVVVVEQEAVGRMFFLHRTVHVLLEIRRTPAGLSFNDSAHKDFWIYNGDWEAVPAAGGTRVGYRLLAQPDFPAPSFMLKGAMRRGARDLLAQVRAEILRRRAMP